MRGRGWVGGVARVMLSTMPRAKLGLREWLQLIIQPSDSRTYRYCEVEFYFHPGGCLGTKLLLNIKQELVV